MPDFSMQAKQLANRITMNVTIGTKGYRAWRWRMAAGVWLIRLGASVMQTNISIKPEFSPTSALTDKERMEILGYVPGDTTTTLSLPRKEVTESLGRSLTDHADVWAEMAKEGDET